MRRFRPYLKYLRAVRGPLFGALFFAVIYGAASGLAINYIIKEVLPRLFDKGAATLSFLQILGYASLIPAVFLIRGVAGYLNTYLITLCGVRVLERLRLDFFSRLQVLPLAFFATRQTGDLISRGIADTNQLQFTLTSVANDLFKQPAQLLGAIGYLAWLALANHDVAFLLLCLCSIPLCVFPVRYVGKHLQRRANQLQAEMGVVTGALSENIGAAKEVRAFGLEQREEERFGRATRMLVTYQMKAVKYAGFLTPAIEFISALGIAATLIYVYRAGFELAVFMSILSALYMCYDPVKKLGAINSELKRGSAALARLDDVFNEPLVIADPAQPVAVGRLRGDVAFEQVSFAYKSDLPVLTEVSIAIPAGTVCALVGPSGAGKTTFANLVPRFYEVASGRVTIDGIDVRAMRLADLRRNIAIVSQDPVLFNDTILANLMLGRADATRPEVEQAARDAFAHDFIKTLPQGYDTIVGERGASLSGGQRQRVALARAFLRNAPILILDEATSALDSESEGFIQTALQKLVVGKTVFIIAHRFSTIRDATKILVFERGRIIASGSHGELHTGNALYKSLYDRQSTAALQPAP
ncbi:ABC transporter ATP-binding protein [Horticoccus sp. 23ND18S-11]|uniref:ABC transporter ATP-binding protein n=1 Tax=Horticoccus sp. 23ND18S-11 TaxID=3391832 RepID=UPI0039C9B3A9